MKSIVKAVWLTAALVAAPAAALAEPPATPPGQKMQETTGPGASKYTTPGTKPDTPPGQQMQDDPKGSGPGASEYAPGNQNDASPGASDNKKTK